MVVNTDMIAITYFHGMTARRTTSVFRLKAGTFLLERCQRFRDGILARFPHRILYLLKNGLIMHACVYAWFILALTRRRYAMHIIKLQSLILPFCPLALINMAMQSWFVRTCSWDSFFNAVSMFCIIKSIFLADYCGLLKKH